MTDKQNYFTYTDNTSDNNDKIMENLYKQIIIDGCDVSGCEFLGVELTKKRMCMCSMIDFCNEEPNCYYKQLKAKGQELQEAMDDYVKLDNQRVKEYNELVDKYKTKEQECERLRFPMSDTNYAILTKEEFEQLDQLKAENEVLEKVNKTNQEKIKKLNEQLEEEFITQQYADMALFWKVEDYKQALTEIKEIAEQHNAYAYCNSKVDMRKILQKCEVLDEHN